MSHALDSVCWRFPDGLVSLQASVSGIFEGIAVVAQKRQKKTRQNECEGLRVGVYNSERLTALEVLRFTKEYLVARAEIRYWHKLDPTSQIENNCYSRRILNRGFLVRFILI
jgi:hypothetical protein